MTKRRLLEVEQKLVRILDRRVTKEGYALASTRDGAMYGYLDPDTMCGCLAGVVSRIEDSVGSLGPCMDSAAALLGLTARELSILESGFEGWVSWYAADGLYDLGRRMAERYCVRNS